MANEAKALDMDTVELVIFDCDGVLIDSEKITNQVDAEELSRIGYETTSEKLVRQFSGMPYPDMLRAIENEMGRPLPDGFAENINRIIHDRFQTELEAIDGVHDLVAVLDKAKCVASSTHMEKLQMCLELVGLLPHFDPHVYSASQVARGKPAPDLFLFTAKTMDVLPERCLVIEDSHAGVTAARAAGMPVMGFTGAGHSYPGHADVLRQAGAGTVIGHMSDVRQHLIG